MKKTRYVFASLAALALVATACGSDNKNTSSTAAPGGTAAAAATTAAPAATSAAATTAADTAVADTVDVTAGQGHHDRRHHPR